MTPLAPTEPARLLANASGGVKYM